MYIPSFQEPLIPVDKLIALLVRLPAGSYVAALQGHLMVLRYDEQENLIPTHLIDIGEETIGEQETIDYYMSQCAINEK